MTAFWFALKISAHCAPFHEFFEVQMKIFILAINILALFIIYLYRGDLIGLGWDLYKPIISFLWLFSMGILYCFHRSEKWRKLLYPLVFIVEILAFCSVYFNIVHNDKQYVSYALLYFNLTFIVGLVIFALSELNDRLEKLEH